ncbi:hypothetical protein WMY93_033870, partial [Mugilogobius chulae]
MATADKSDDTERENQIEDASKGVSYEKEKYHKAEPDSSEMKRTHKTTLKTIQKGRNLTPTVEIKDETNQDDGLQKDQADKEESPQIPSAPSP